MPTVGMAASKPVSGMSLRPKCSRISGRDALGALTSIFLPSLPTSVTRTASGVSPSFPEVVIQPTMESVSLTPVTPAEGLDPFRRSMFASHASMLVSGIAATVATALVLGGPRLVGSRAAQQGDGEVVAVMQFAIANAGEAQGQVAGIAAEIGARPESWFAYSWLVEMRFHVWSKVADGPDVRLPSVGVGDGQQRRLRARFRPCR